MALGTREMGLSDILTEEQQRELIDLAEGRTGEKPNGKEQDAEDQLKSFPEAAWTGLFRTWRDIAAPCTEAPLENLWAAFLVAAGLMLGRSVWKVSPSPLYPNFYLLLLGQTGDSKKSTTLWLAGELLRKIEEDVEILTGIVSTEGLFERLAKKDGTKVLGYVDEFRSLLSVAKGRKATQDLLPKINSLYSCPRQEEINRREKSTTVVRPFFSIIAATPEDYVEDLLGHIDLVGGMLNRFLMVTGDEQEPKPETEPPTPEAWRSITEPLRIIRNKWLSNPRRLELSPEAKVLWANFYIGWKKGRKKLDQSVANLSARTFEHILKIALVYSVLSGQDNIDARSLATAIIIGQWLETTRLRLFGNVSLDSFSKAEALILGRLKEKGRQYVRDLQQWGGRRRINGKIFREVLKTLTDNDHIKRGVDTTMANRERPYVEIVYG